MAKVLKQLCAYVAVEVAKLSQLARASLAVEGLVANEGVNQKWDVAWPGWWRNSWKNSTDPVVFTVKPQWKPNAKETDVLKVSGVCRSTSKSRSSTSPHVEAPKKNYASQKYRVYLVWKAAQITAVNGVTGDGYILDLMLNYFIYVRERASSLSLVYSWIQVFQEKLFCRCVGKELLKMNNGPGGIPGSS